MQTNRTNSPFPTFVTKYPNMRYLLHLALFCLPCLLPAQGLRFEQGAWDELLAKAKKENKWVFLDAVTSWCGPCKMMSKNVFPEPEVGAFFNERFVSVQLDMEKGEGIEISNRYKVWLYPTLIFLNADGMVQHRSSGYLLPDALIALAKTALDTTQNLAALEKKYLGGNRDRDFMLAFIEAKTAAYDPDASRLANEFLRLEADYGSPQSMDLIMRHIDDPYSDGFRHLLKNRPEFEEKYGKREVKVKIESVFEAYLQKNPQLQLGEIQRLYGTLYPERGEELASRCRLDYYRQRHDDEAFARCAVDHYARFPSDDPDELGEMALIFAESVSDRSQLRQALAWSNKSLSVHETAYAYYVHARVLSKLGDHKAARKAAKKSKKLAKNSGEDSMLVDEFLKSIR
jgi:thioredoxin-related protein